MSSGLWLTLGRTLGRRFWVRAGEARSLEATVQSLSLARMTGSFQWVNALLVGSALRASQTQLMPTGDLCALFPELRMVWEDVIRSETLQRYAVERLRETGAEEHDDGAAGQIARRVSDYSQFLETAAGVQAISDDVMVDIVRSEGLVAHLQGFGKGKIGYTATRALECAAVLTTGWLQLGASCRSSHANEAALKKFWSALLSFHRQVSTIVDLLALPASEQDSAMRRARSTGFLQGPQMLSSMVRAEVEASPEASLGLSFTFCGLSFFKEAFRHSMTFMHTALPFINASPG